METALVKQMIWSQFGAAIETLENAIAKCPDELWNDQTRKPQYWYVAYHALFFIDLYLSDSLKGFAPPPPFTLSELDRSRKMPERIYSKQELQSYLEYGRNKCQERLKSITEEKLHQACSFSWVKVTNAELFLYNTRHIQHHAGQLNLIIRQVMGAGSEWIFKARE